MRKRVDERADPPRNRSMPPGDVIPEMGYPDVIFAAEWLCRAFGFRERIRIGTHRVQLHAGRGSLVVTDRAPAEEVRTCGHRLMVRVDDVDAHAAAAVRAGAHVVSPPTTYPFGERQYTVEDFTGQEWVFSQTMGDVDPATWGGVLVSAP